jgi:DNA-binding transcriptional LysR family regulator
LDGVEALLIFASVGTVSEAALRLRLTQSAVSKRLATLAAQVGYAVVEPDGRRLRLTPRGAELVAKAKPLLAELRELTRADGAPGLLTLELALADSIASSWGPALVKRALARCPSVTVELHAHRSVLVLESVRLGRYDAGLAVLPESPADLVVEQLTAEPMCLVLSGRGPRWDKAAPLVTIEPSSSTWRAIHPLLRAHHPALLEGRRIAVESFGAVARMAEAGFGNGLVPVGLADELRIPARARRPLAHVKRSVALFTRKTVAARDAYARLRDELVRAARERSGPS